MMVGLYPKEKTVICTFVILYLTQIAYSQHPQNDQDVHGLTWPVTLTFYETKTNDKLGEALLNRLYARIGFTDNIIRAEVDTLFDRLKEVIEKRLRKCERKRRRAGSTRSQPNLESMYGHQNTSVPHHYSQKRTNKQGPY